MQKVIGVIGCGRISDIAHFPTLSQIEGVRIKYGCDIIPEKAEAMKKKYPKIERTVADYKEVLADPEVDAVYVLTPNYAHYTITMDALKALMDATDKVRITAPDTDLRFSIKGIGSEKCAGQRNIPDGEIYSAPVKDSVNGYIHYTAPSVEFSMGMTP